LRAGMVEAMPLLARRAVGDPSTRVRLAAVDAIEWLGPTAWPVALTLARGLIDPNNFVRWATARVIGKIGVVDEQVTAVVVPLLARLLCDYDLDVELAAANALGLYGPDAAAAVPALAQAVMRCKGSTGRLTPPSRRSRGRWPTPIQACAAPPPKRSASSATHPERRSRRCKGFSMISTPMCARPLPTRFCRSRAASKVRCVDHAVQLSGPHRGPCGARRRANKEGCILLASGTAHRGNTCSSRRCWQYSM
jgi:hypothetical protein